ncbi:hypothetical protein IFO69_19695 [Echinicola sp. CAU 1574]|uniref:Lipoprotein n=1 Tax=Echinicola arenosa TaxID=2774144 RepID=A0ABR9ARJ0_9BACT|nr:hypothetical protein [Echinicola arenosa]MBD8490986.1 hypothetical protein [Echinicola arenosa]
MKSKYLILIFFFLFKCTFKSNINEQLLLSSKLEHFTQAEFEEIILYFKDSGKVINLNKDVPLKEYLEYLEQNTNESTFFVFLPEISSKTYLPIFLPTNGPIIDIDINDIVFVNSLNDIEGATEDFKLIFVNASNFKSAELDDLFNCLAKDYLNSINEALHNRALPISEKTKIKIAKKYPLEVWVSTR